MFEAQRAHGWTAAALAAGLMLAALVGCSDGSAVTTGTGASTTSLPVTTTVAPTATTALVTTTTAATTTTVETEVWDVVALGDSYVAGAGLGPGGGDDPERAFPGIYTRALGEQLGVEAMLHAYVDYGTVAGWNSVLARSTGTREQISEAEVVIVWLGYHNVVDALYFQSCGTEWSEHLRSCLEEATRTMPADFDQLLGTIESLVAQGTVVMVANQGLSPIEIDEWGNEPFWPELKALAFDGWSAGVEAATAAHGAIFIDSAVWLMGPDGNQVLHREYLLPDGIHFTEAGHAALAALFLEADGLGD